MGVKDYFPRQEFALSLTPVAVDYLAKLQNLVQALADIIQAQGDITTLQANYTAALARIVALEAEIEDVPLQERPGGALAFAQATAPVTNAFTATVTASENIAAGDFTNFYSSGGAGRVRRADATDATKFANSFVLAAITSGTAGAVTLLGLNSALTVAVPASETWLSDTTPGGYLTSAPTTAGDIDQGLGEAIVGVGILFTPKLPILLS